MRRILPLWSIARWHERCSLIGSRILGPVVAAIFLLFSCLPGLSQVYDLNDESTMLKLAQAPICGSRWHIIVESECSVKEEWGLEDYSRSFETSIQYHLEGEFEIEDLDAGMSPADLFFAMELPVPPTFSVPVTGTISWQDSEFLVKDRSGQRWCEAASDSEALSGVLKFYYLDGGKEEEDWSFFGRQIWFFEWDGALPRYEVQCIERFGIFTERLKVTRKIDITEMWVPALPLHPGTYVLESEDLGGSFLSWKKTITLMPLCEITWVGDPPSKSPIPCDPVNLPYVMPYVMARAPAGGSSYNWSITQGQDKLRVVSGASAQYVEFELREPSNTPNDVTISVSYRDAEGNLQQCQASFSILQAGGLKRIGEDSHTPFVTHEVEVRRRYQVLSQLGETHPLCVDGLEVREILRSVDIHGNPTVWSSGEERALSYNPDLPQFIGHDALSAIVSARSGRIGPQGDFTDTHRIWDTSGMPLPAEINLVIYQEIFVDDCLVGSYEIHYEHDRVTIIP